MSAAETDAIAPFLNILVAYMEQYIDVSDFVTPIKYSINTLLYHTTNYA